MSDKKDQIGKRKKVPTLCPKISFWQLHVEHISDSHKFQTSTEHGPRMSCPPHLKGNR